MGVGELIAGVRHGSRSSARGRAGSAAVIALRTWASTDVVVLERHDGVGGTWHEDRYPGCACDVPSHLDSSSRGKRDLVAPRRPATRDPAVHGAPRRVPGAARLPVGSGVAVRRHEDVVLWGASARRRWSDRGRGPISAIGMFNDVVVPDIEGLDTFAGTMFTGWWDWDHDLAGERVAVIGSAGQGRAVVPEPQTSDNPPLPAHGELGPAEARHALHRRRAETSAVTPRRSWRRATSCSRRRTPA